MRISLFTALLCLTAAPAVAQDEPRVGPERIILSTPAGDLVLALYPDVAPKHVEQLLRLVHLGVYDGTHFYRIEPDFVLQTSTAADRSAPLTPEQKAAIHPIPAEFSSLHHRRGVLSMAHDDGKPDSGETSFSILLGDAPHLDGKYTIFGHVETGMDVIDELCKAPRIGTQPAERLEIRRAVVVDSPEKLTYLRLAGPRPIASTQPATPPGDLTRSGNMVGGLVLMVLCGLACFLFAGRLPARILLSLNLLVVLVGGFLLFAILVPVAYSHAALAVVLFLGVLGMLKLMGRFESPA